jgi:hypothetical protein
MENKQSEDLSDNMLYFGFGIFFIIGPFHDEAKQFSSFQEMRSAQA